MSFYKVIVILGILLPFHLNALSIKTNDGKIYKNIKGVTRHPDGLVIISKTGKFKKLDFRNLSKEIQEKYKYDPESAEEYRKKHPKQKTAYQLRLDRKSARKRAKELAEKRRKEALENEKLREQMLKLNLGARDSSVFIKKLTDSARKFKASGKSEKVSPLNTVVIIKGDKGVGTGFIANLKGVKVVVSNAHVLVGNSKIEITDISGRRIKFKTINLAKDRDVAVYELEDADGLKYLDVDYRPEDVPLDSDISVYGNSLGEGVVTSIKGKLKGIGPNKIEVDSDFVQGNSGSPIVNADGKVIGIATYIKQIRKDWTTKDTRFSEPRRFGVRVDNINLRDLQNIKPAAYLKNLEVYNRLLLKNKLAMSVLKDLFENMVLGEELYDDKELKAVASKWNAGIKKRKPSKEAIEDLKKYLTSSVKTVPYFTTEYMKNSFKTELMKNEALLKVCDFVYGKAAEYAQQGGSNSHSSSGLNLLDSGSSKFTKEELAKYNFMGKSPDEIIQLLGEPVSSKQYRKRGYTENMYSWDGLNLSIIFVDKKVVVYKILVERQRLTRGLLAKIIMGAGDGSSWKKADSQGIMIAEDKKMAMKFSSQMYFGCSFCFSFVNLEFIKGNRRFRNNRDYRWVRVLK